MHVVRLESKIHRLFIDIDLLCGLFGTSFLPFLLLCQRRRHIYFAGLVSIDLSLIHIGIDRSLAAVEIGRFHLVVIIQMVILNDFYQLGRVGRIGGIACLLQTMGPRLVVCYIIVEQRLIPVSITKKI